jgi:hypothetical protein
MITRLPLLISAFLAVTVILLTIYLSKLKDGEKNRKKILLYLLAGGILIGLTFIIGFKEFPTLPYWIFIAANIWLLGIGILHVWLYDKVIPGQGSDTWKILFTLALFFFGYSLIFLLYKFVIKGAFPWIFLSPGFFFLAPALIITAFDHFTDIPARVFREWNFPPPGTLSDPSDSEMADPIIINFEIRKGINDNRTVFKAKAPKGMTLGRLFYYFVMDYNSRYPDNTVLISVGENSYFKWSFFITGSIFSGKTYPDPDLTISDNKIKENASVICERVIS